MWVPLFQETSICHYISTSTLYIIHIPYKYNIYTSGSFQFARQNRHRVVSHRSGVLQCSHRQGSQVAAPGRVPGALDTVDERERESIQYYSIKIAAMWI
jgi:hypothetical protein